MISRAKLHQRHSPINSQANSFSSIPLTVRPVEGSCKLDRLSKLQNRVAKISHTHINLRSLKDEDKTETPSNSYTNSFLSEDAELEQKSLGAQNIDCCADHVCGTESLDVNYPPSREPEAAIQKLDPILKNIPQGSHSCDTKKESHPLLCSDMRGQEEVGSEGSDLSTGRGPEGLDKPPEASLDQNFDRKRKVRRVPDQMAGKDVGRIQLSAANESITFHECSFSDQSAAAVHNLMHAKEYEKGPSTPLHIGARLDEETVIRARKQTHFEQKTCNAEELPVHQVGECPSSILRGGAQNNQISKRLNVKGGDSKLAVNADRQTFPGTNVPDGTTQNGWPLEMEKCNSQRHASKKEADCQSHCNILRTNEEHLVELSDRGTEKGSETLDEPPEVDSGGSRAHQRKSKFRPVPDPWVDNEVSKVRLLSNDESSSCQNHIFGGVDRLPDTAPSLVDAEEKTERELCRPLHPIVKESEEPLSLGIERQRRLLQKERDAQELLEYGTGKILSSVCQDRAQKLDHSKGPLHGGRDDEAAVEKVNAVSCELEESSQGPIDEQTEAKTSHEADPKVSSSSQGTPNNDDVRVPKFEASQTMEIIKDELTSTKETVGMSKVKSLLSADASLIMTTKVLQSSLPFLAKSKTSIPVLPTLHHSLHAPHQPVELPSQKPVQCNPGASSKEIEQMEVNDICHLTGSNEGKLSDIAATTVPDLTNAAPQIPLSKVSGSTTEERPLRCLSSSSHMDFSTIKEKLKNNKLANARHSITEDEAGDSFNHSSDSLTSTNEGKLFEGNAQVSGSIMKAINPSSSKHKSICLDQEQASKSKSPPKEDATQENSMQTLSTGPESAKVSTNLSKHLIGARGLVIPECPTSELPSFLPSFYRQMTYTDLAEEVSSVISEDIEHCESEIQEDIQNDVEGLALKKCESMCSPKSISTFSSMPDVVLSLGSRSPDVQVIQPESGSSLTNTLTEKLDHAQSCHLTDRFNQGLTEEDPEPRLASRTGSPCIKSERCYEGLPLLQSGGQMKSFTSTCASPDLSVGKAIGRVERIRPSRSEDSSPHDIFRVSEDFYCGFDISNNHSDISEDLPSLESDISSSRSGPAQVKTFRIDRIELHKREEKNEVGNVNSINQGQHPYFKAVACAPSDPCNLHLADERLPGGVVDLPKRTRTGKQHPESNLLYTSFRVTDEASLEEHSLHGILVPKSESEKSLEPLPSASRPTSSIILPPLRPLKPFKEYAGTHFSEALRTAKLSCKDAGPEKALSNDDDSLSTQMAGLQLECACTESFPDTLSAASPLPNCSPGVMVKNFNTVFRCKQDSPETTCTLDITKIEAEQIQVQTRSEDEVSCLSAHQTGLEVYSPRKVTCLGKISDSSTESPPIEDTKKAGELCSETFTLSKKVRGVGFPLGSQKINMYKQVTDAAAAVYHNKLAESEAVALQIASPVGKEHLPTLFPLDTTVPSPSPGGTNDTLDPCSYLRRIGNESVALAEGNNARIESSKSFLLIDGESIGSAPSSQHIVVLENEDALFPAKSEDGHRLPSAYSTPNKFIDSYQGSKLSGPSALFRQQVPKLYLNNDAHTKFKVGAQVLFRDVERNSEPEVHADQQNFGASSLQVNSLERHDWIFESTCSNKDGFVTELPEHISKSNLSVEALESRIAQDLEACASDLSQRSSLNFAEEKIETRTSKIPEGAGIVSMYQVSGFRVPEGRRKPTTVLDSLHETPICANTSTKPGVRMQLDLHRVEKLEIMTGIVTSLIYEELLSGELSGKYKRALTEGGLMSVCSSV